MPNSAYIGLDLGGTRIRAARFNANLEMQQRIETLTLDEQGLEAVIKRMVEQVKAVWPTDGTKVEAVGVSAPGPIDPTAGIITMPPNLKGWHNVPLKQLLEGPLGVPVYLGNDANLAALAETKMGAARGYRHVIYLTISTGIGSGIIIDDKLFVGSRGVGAECGHLIMIADGDRVSTFEKEASGTAIAKQAIAAIEQGETSIMLDMAEGAIDAVNAKIVGAAAQAGDKLALRLVQRAGRMIGLGIVSLLHAFNPEIIVLGGGVVDGTWDILYKPMMDAIQKYALDASYWENLVIDRAQLGENVSIIGAGALGLHKGAS